MSKAPQDVEILNVNESPADRRTASRRKFLGQVGGAAAAALAANALVSPTEADAQVAAPHVPPAVAARVQTDYNKRLAIANRALAVPAAPHNTNGDEQRYADWSGSYSKGLLQDDIGVVNPGAWASFQTALANPTMANWNALITGGPRTQNGPQGAYAYDVEGDDSTQFGNTPWPPSGHTPVVCPPAPAVASETYGSELLEHYWAALLSDVAFTDYSTNTTAITAAAELNTFPGYNGPRDSFGRVTTANLFRGNFQGEQAGPYISQAFITPTNFGHQTLSQQFSRFVPGVLYMTNETAYQAVQNGSKPAGAAIDTSNNYFMQNGRGLATWTHDDVLYQGLFIAGLVLAGLKVPSNPGNPYNGNLTQNGFCTFGGPDIFQTVGEVAARALQRVWFQKWLIHLRHRPEAGGALLRQQLNPNGHTKLPLAKVNNNVLNSQGVAQCHSQFGDYFLPQNFPEGSPTHPCYPTGHGTVAGAGITVLKFFFDCSQKWSTYGAVQQPSSDGLSLQPYAGTDGGDLTINGELNKLASNISFGHGIHAGIHFRSSTLNSMLLGEALALSILRDKASLYNEKFSVTITRLDGSPYTISN